MIGLSTNTRSVILPALSAEFDIFYILVDLKFDLHFPDSQKGEHLSINLSVTCISFSVNFYSCL